MASSHPLFTAQPRRALLALALACGAALLSGCYVVPLNQAPPAYQHQMPVPVAQPPTPVTFSARLYPANEQATRYGMVGAVVTNDLHGRGTFSATIQGESFFGEATRKAGSSRDGLASGAGSKGGYLSCQYMMNSSTLGTGTCSLSNGAEFTMHIGQ